MGGCVMRKKRKAADADYFANRCSELAELAEQEGFDLGSYLLKMACLEFSKQRFETDSRAIVPAVAAVE